MPLLIDSVASTCIPASIMINEGEPGCHIESQWKMQLYTNAFNYYKRLDNQQPQIQSLFKGIGHFNCTPVSIELQGHAEHVRKAPHKVPLALKDKFNAEIQSMVDQGILTEVTQTMKTPKWLNSFVIVKKPNGNYVYV